MKELLPESDAMQSPSTGHPARWVLSARPILGWTLVLVLSCPPAVLAQTRIGVIVGVVLDARTQLPVPNAAVSLPGTSHAVAADTGGAFRIQGVVAGRYMLRVEHLAYGARTLEVDVRAGEPTEVRLLLSETAIELAPLTVNALSSEEMRARGAGFRRSIVTRAQIAAAEGTNMTLVDVLQAHVPTVRVRRLERIVGSPTCVEFRSGRTLNDVGCLSPAVYLDGTPITDPTSLYGTLDIRVIETMELVPANEAGVRFGPHARHGALLIETRRPGGNVAADPLSRGSVFDWSLEPNGHSTGRVLLASAIGNAAGLGTGLLAARQCLRLRTPGHSGLVSDCEAIPTVGVTLAALLLPALGSGYGSRLAGQTDLSRGRFAPAMVGAAMVVLPAYAMIMTGRRNNSDGLKAVGYVSLIVGAPVISTVADYLFRRTREERAPEPK